MDVGAVKSAIQFLQEYGAAAGLVLVLIGIHRRWWVPGWYATRLEQECAAWREATLTSTNLAGRATAAAELQVQLRNTQK